MMEHSYQHQFDLYRQTIAEWHEYHKATSPGTTALLKKRFEQYEYNYHKYIAEYRKTKKQKPLRLALQVVDQAEKEFNQFKKMEFIAALSK